MSAFHSQKGNLASRESPPRGSPLERQRNSTRRTTPDIPPRTGSQSSRLAPARASSGSSSGEPLSHSVGHIGKSRSADSTAPLSQSYSFLPLGTHAELLIVSCPTIDDLLYAHQDPAPLLHLKIPEHAQIPGDCSLILQVGPKRRRVFTYPSSKAQARAGLDRTEAGETLLKSVAARKVLREHIGTVERIVRGFKVEENMSSRQWAVALMDLCDKEGCFVEMPENFR